MNENTKDDTLESRIQAVVDNVDHTNKLMRVAVANSEYARLKPEEREFPHVENSIMMKAGPDTSYAQTPWEVEGSVIFDSEGAGICAMHHISGDRKKRIATASRIVACVNACVGLSTEALEIGGDALRFARTDRTEAIQAIEQYQQLNADYTKLQKQYQDVINFLSDMDEYLNQTQQTSIGCGSIYHHMMKDAVERSGATPC